jgi:hypothetical protein
VLASGLAGQAPNMRLESGRAGQFELGQSVDNVLSLAGRQHVRLVNLDFEGMFTPAIEIRLADLPTACRSRKSCCGRTRMASAHVAVPLVIRRAS